MAENLMMESTERQQKYVAEQEAKGDYGLSGRAEGELGVGGRTGANGDKGIVVAEPMDQVQAEAKVGAVAEKGVGQKIAVADDDNALLPVFKRVPLHIEFAGEHQTDV